DPMAGEETADERPGHRRRLGEDLGEVATTPDRAVWVGTDGEGSDLLAADILAGGGAGRDGASLQQPELSAGRGPLDIPGSAEQRFHATAKLNELEQLLVVET